jgi:AraC-like DNA-binding protein
VSIRFRAGDEPVGSRREYWQQVTAGAIGGLELRIAGDLDAADRVVAGKVGVVRVGALRSRWPGGAVRTARHVRRAGSDLCKIDLPVDGAGLVEQDGRAARLAAGDFALVDLSRPARWVMPPGRVVAMVFPASLLPLSAAQVRQTTAVAVKGEGGAGRVVSSLARELVGRVDEYGAGEAARLGTVVLDLVATAVCARVGGDVAAEARQRVLALQVREFIDANLADPELSVGVLAAANHVSVRAVHRVFEAQDTTAGELIRQRRLERCRQDLGDPRLAHLPVSAIARRWGIPIPGQFSRAFRARYGMSPTEYRASVT